MLGAEDGAERWPWRSGSCCGARPATQPRGPAPAALSQRPSEHEWGWRSRPLASRPPRSSVTEHPNRSTTGHNKPSVGVSRRDRGHAAHRVRPLNISTVPPRQRGPVVEADCSPNWRPPEGPDSPWFWEGVLIQRPLSESWPRRLDRAPLSERGRAGCRSGGWPFVWMVRSLDRHAPPEPVRPD